MWKALKPKRKGKKAKKRKYRDSERDLRRKKKKKKMELGKKNREEEGRRRGGEEGGQRKLLYWWLIIIIIIFSFSVIYSCRLKLVYRPKLAEMTKTRRNGLKFFPRWIKRVFRSGLHTGMRFSGQNGMIYTTLLWTAWFVVWWVRMWCGHGSVLLVRCWRGFQIQMGMGYWMGWVSVGQTWLGVNLIIIY